jgi:hypothetical protein
MWGEGISRTLLACSIKRARGLGSQVGGEGAELRGSPALPSLEAQAVGSKLAMLLATLSYRYGIGPGAGGGVSGCCILQVSWGSRLPLSLPLGLSLLCQAKGRDRFRGRELGGERDLTED